MSNLTENEKKAVRFYIGDVSEKSGFYSDPKAYVTINSLFFPDISTETARAAEGKYLNPEIIGNVPELLSFFSSLFSAFSKSSAGRDVTTYRVERFADYQLSKKLSRTVSFTSTSTAGFLDSYRDRKGIALMKFAVCAETSCIDVGAILPYYAKPEEAEIILPPFAPIEIKENVLSENERAITDSDGLPPLVSCSVTMKKKERFDGEIPKLDDNGARAGMRICTKLNEDEKPHREDIEIYSLWKKDLQKILLSMAET